MQDHLNFTVKLAADGRLSGRWLSPALQLPEANLIAVTNDQGEKVDGATLHDQAILAAISQSARLEATIEVPANLVLQATLDREKLMLEREKMNLEDFGRRRTWQWGIGSAVLTAIVTLMAAFGSRPVPADGKFLPSADSVEACRASLERLPLLALVSNQTVTSLGEAVRRHHADCNEVLFKLSNRRS